MAYPKTSTLPTMEQMTSMYLFGTLEKPNNLLDENLIRPKDLIVDYPVKININEYMTDGPGRFVSAKDFKFLDEFFTKSSTASKNLEAGRYTKSEIFQIFGTKSAVVKQSTSEYDDGKDDLLARAYIWNSVAFMVNDDAVFVVDENGNRSIENFAIVPNSKDEEQYRDENGKPMDNFDFTGGTTSQIVNSLLESKIDPSGIGRKVNIKFDWDNIDTKTLTYQDYLNEETSLGSWINQGSVGWDSFFTNNLVKELWDTGVIQFLDEENRIILYGTQDSDQFNASELHTKLVKLYSELSEKDFSQSGIVYVAGDGHDSITGTDYNDRLIGGDGIDSLDGGKGADRLEGGKDFDLYHTDNGDTVFDEDGKGVIFFNGKSLGQFQVDSQYDSIWYELDKDGNQTGVIVQKSGANLLLSDKDGNNATIENFFQVGNELNNGYFGLNIFLPNKEDTQPETNDYLLWTGDIRPETDDNGKYQVNWLDHSARNENGEIINGTAQAGFNDVIIGQAGVSNKIYGLDGNDALHGKDGNDVIDGGNGDDLIVGGGGTDIIYGGAGKDYIYSNVSWELKLRNSDEDEWRPNDRNYIGTYTWGSTWGVYAVSGGWYKIGGMSNETQHSDDEKQGDTLYGGSGKDTVVGGNNDDIIYGDGADNENGQQIGEDDNDTVLGMGGDDLIYGGGGDDTILGDGGTIEEDTLQYTPLTENGNDTIYAGNGKDWVYGNGGDDVIFGEDGDDELYGDFKNKPESKQFAEFNGDDLIDGGDDWFSGSLKSHDRLHFYVI